MEDLKHRLIKSSFVSYLGAKGNVSDNSFYHESWVMWAVEFLTQEYNIMECVCNHIKLGIRFTLLFYQIESLKNGAFIILPSSIARNS